MSAKVLAPACRLDAAMHSAMHTSEEHQAIADRPKLLAALTSNPRAQWLNGTAVLFVWRDCHCGSTIAVTVAQETAARDISRVGTGLADIK